MTKTIELDEADESLARCVREVETGEECVFTRNGRPVARLVPVPQERVLTPEREAALERVRARMEKGWLLNAGPLDRDELYDNVRRPYDPKRRR